MGVENSSSVLAAASIELSHKTSVKCEEVIHCVRAVMYSVSRDLKTGERCWITVMLPLEKTVSIEVVRSVSLEPPSVILMRDVSYLLAQS